MHLNVDYVNDRVNQLTHMLGPAGSIINKNKAIKEISERISSSTEVGMAESQMRLEWKSLKKNGTPNMTTMT